MYVERDRSAVECHTRKRESPGSHPPLPSFLSFAISVLAPRRPSINECLAIDSGGNVSE